jgi:NAD(P)-dependent dehydrogenase (short-subunit alcohol dehydrogenase family)
MGGFITMPGIAFYCGSKFALEGISETLAKEVKGFGWPKNAGDLALSEPSKLQSPFFEAPAR